MNNQTVREQFKQFLKDSGVKMKFIANKLNWCYVNMSAFKNGKLDYSTERLHELKRFMSKYE